MRLVRTALTASIVALLVAGCSSDKAGTTTSATAPEDKRASAADVAAGLKKIDGIASGIASNAADKAKAEPLVAQIEPVWQAIEGTVKANDQDAYLTFEDSFALLETAVKDGDVAKAQKGSADVSGAVTAYLGKYPG